MYLKYLCISTKIVMLWMFRPLSSKSGKGPKDIKLGNTFPIPRNL